MLAVVALTIFPRLGQHTSGILVLNAHTDCLSSRFTLAGIGLLSSTRSGRHLTRFTHSPLTPSGVVQPPFSASSSGKKEIWLATLRMNKKRTKREMLKVRLLQRCILVTNVSDTKNCSGCGSRRRRLIMVSDCRYTAQTTLKLCTFFRAVSSPPSSQL